MAGDEKPAKDWRLTDPRYDTELWAFDYDNYSYLERVSDEDLHIRYKEIVNNVGHLVCSLRDTFPARDHIKSSWWWLKIKFQTELEYSHRGIALPGVKETLSIPEGPDAYTPSTPNECNFVVRYGEAKWLMPMLTEGTIRISPASRYNSEVLEIDNARHADELKNHRYVPGNRLTISHARTGQAIPILGNFMHTIRARDYYVLCFSHEFDYRLFSSFKNDQGETADACLVINNIDEFAKRLDVAMQERFSNWNFYWNRVFYFEPYYNVPGKTKPTPGAYKDFKYAYQREYRFLWHPLSFDPWPRLATFDIKLGSLEDIAILHYYQDYKAGRYSRLCP
jgi:hypothetical protein